MNYDDESLAIANQLFTDNVNTPSELTGNSFDLADMVNTWY